MNKKGILFVLSGPSGVGKGTVRKALLPDMDNIVLSVSATTRKPRNGEVDSKDYFFLEKDEFERLVKKDNFLEWASVYNNMYGTPRTFVESNLKNGQDVLLEIDIQGALQVKKRMPEGVFIFLSPPNLDELARRLCGRGTDSQDSIELRLAACKQEMEYIKYYDYLVENNHVSDTVERVRAIIMAERCRIRN